MGDFPWAQVGMLQEPFSSFGAGEVPRLRLGLLVAGPGQGGEEGRSTSACGAQDGADVIGRVDMAPWYGIVSAIVPFGVREAMQRLQNRATI